MADSQTVSVSVPKACPHENLDFQITDVRQAGINYTARIQVKCKDCPAVFRFMDAKGRVAPVMTLAFGENVGQRGKPVPNAAAAAGKVAAAPAGKGPGTELLRINAAIGFRGCTLCRDLAARMDANGPAWCREHFDELAAEILVNARKYAENAETLLGGLMGRAANLVTDDLLMKGIRHNLTAAIEAAETKPTEK